MEPRDRTAIMLIVLGMMMFAAGAFLAAAEWLTIPGAVGVGLLVWGALLIATGREIGTGEPEGDG